jgi:hypothetical protein
MLTLRPFLIYFQARALAQKKKTKKKSHKQRKKKRNKGENQEIKRKNIGNIKIEKEDQK